jgi:REP element-mobilizing transposase RayT
MEPAVRHLEDARLANEVRESLYHFAGERYEIYAYVIMPSHFHWAFRSREEWVESLGSDGGSRRPREKIMHSVKLHSARECNRILETRGTFWQDESYDHCVLDADELLRIIEYVEMNPVKAGYVDSPEQWQFSSARDRLDSGVCHGDPYALRRRE